MTTRDLIDPPSTLGPADRAPVPALRLEGLSKRYGAVQAIRDVGLEIQSGEVRALLGQNGAGKSTLVKILSGATRADSGTIALLGSTVSVDSPHAARKMGISTVHQELSLVPDLTVAENLFLGDLPRKAGFGGVDHQRMMTTASQLLTQLEVDIDVRRRTADLPVALQQVVEIAKGLRSEPRVLILDEPTSALPSSEVQVVLGVVRRLAEAGVAVIYVSHRMSEIPEVADTVSVLRNGELVGTREIGAASLAWIVEAMTGARPVRASCHHSTARSGPVVLDARDLRSRVLDRASISLKQGEVVGITGLLGAGKTELLHAILDSSTVSSGHVAVNGQTVARRSPAVMVRHAVGFAPEDRKGSGLALDLSVLDNVLMAAWSRHTRRGLLRRRSATTSASRISLDLGIKAQSLVDPVSTLSGGNQQKVVLARWLAAGAAILLLDEPTRGVDVHARQQIYEVLRHLANDGLSVMFATSDVDELFVATDRIAVMTHGRVVAECATRDTTADEITALAMAGTLADDRPSDRSTP